MNKFLAIAAGISALALTLSACESSADEHSPEMDGLAEHATLTVFAAASLTDTFEQLAVQFSDSHDGVEMQLSFAGSSDLVTQIQEGAPADVIATADERTMQQLVDAGIVAGDPQTFVSNTLAIAVPTGNPERITGLEDLTNPDLDIVICAPQVPCGAATKTVEESAGIDIEAVSEELAVTDALGKVANGQADASLVYRTDAARTEGVETIEFPESQNAVNLYPIAPVADPENAENGSPAKNPENADLAHQFIDFVLSDDARTVFHQAGFAAP